MYAPGMEDTVKTRTRRKPHARIAHMDDDDAAHATPDDVLMAIKAVETIAERYIEVQERVVALLERQCMAIERMEKHALYTARAAASTRKHQGEMEKGVASLVHVAAIYLDATEGA